VTLEVNPLVDNAKLVENCADLNNEDGRCANCKPNYYRCNYNKKCCPNNHVWNGKIMVPLSYLWINCGTANFDDVAKTNLSLDFGECRSCKPGHYKFLNVCVPIGTFYKNSG